MLSIFSWFGYRKLTHTEEFRLIKQAGFDCVLLWWDDDFDGPAFRLQPELARREGLFVENVHANFGRANHLWEDTLEGQGVCEYYLQCLEDCAAFEIPAIVMHASYGEAPPASEIGLRRFARLIEHAERNNVNIALENMRRASQIKEAAFLLERFDSPRLGMCFDSGHHHARLLRTQDADLLARFGHRLMALHLHDNHGTITESNSADEHLLPFDGTIDWPDQMRKIAETGYRGPTTLEVENGGYENVPPEEFLALAYERAKRLEALRNGANNQ